MERGVTLDVLRGEVGKDFVPRLVESYRENDDLTILKTFFIFSH